MDQDDTRVIDSDHQMVQFVPQLLQREQVSSEPDTESREEGFQGGMNVLNTVSYTHLTLPTTERV